MRGEIKHPGDEYADWKAPSDETKQEFSEKQRRWEQLSAEVELIGDALGKGIDPGIKQAVIGFKAFELPTDQSCEGHLEEDHGLPYPWVQIYAPAPEGWQENETLKQKWKDANLTEREKATALLDDFCQKRNTSPDARLINSDFGLFGAFRVQSAGAEHMKELPTDELAEKLQQYRQEMNAFAAFLKQKFLAE